MSSALRRRMLELDNVLLRPWAFLWGQPGTHLEKETGPDEWQQVFLLDLARLRSQRKFDGVNPVDPIQLLQARVSEVAGCSDLV
jgi:hypothetical protein